MTSKNTSIAQLSRRRFLHLAGGALGAMAVGCASKMPPSEETPLPDYVDGGSGIPVFRGPYLQKDARIAAFLLPAHIEALRTLCDTYLNTPTAGAMAYKPFIPYILLLYAEMQIQSLDERDQAIGWMQETEVGFWIPTTRTNQVIWFLPYLFVDNPYAILAGREVYGFPKTLGQFEKATSIHNPEFAVDVLSFSEFAPQAEGKSQRLLEVRKSDDGAPGAVPETWTSWDAAYSALIRLLFKDWQPQANDNGSAQGLADKIPLVFLKQFRDATDSLKACYQAIIEAAAQPGAFYDGGFINAAYTLTCHPLASHPIADPLGLKVDSSGGVQALATFWLRLDFTLGAGVEVWRAP